MDGETEAGMVGRAIALDPLEQEMYERHTGPYKLSADQPSDPRTLALSVGVQSFPFSHGGGEPEEMDWYRRMVAKGLAKIVRGALSTEFVGFVGEVELRLLRAGAAAAIYPTNIGDPSRIGLHRYVARSGDAIAQPPISAETPGEYARGWRDGQAAYVPPPLADARITIGEAMRRGLTEGALDAIVKAWPDDPLNPATIPEEYKATTDEERRAIKADPKAELKF